MLESNLLAQVWEVRAPGWPHAGAWTSPTPGPCPSTVKAVNVKAEVYSGISLQIDLRRWTVTQETSRTAQHTAPALIKQPGETRRNSSYAETP